MPLNTCNHTKLHLDPSPHAEEVGYTQPSSSVLLKATTTSRKPNGRVPPATTFPAPLVLPNDDLALDPKYPLQSFLSWKRLIKGQDPITSVRNKIYYLPLPLSTHSSNTLDTQSWAIPVDTTTKSPIRGVPSPCWEDVVDYLTNFFHPLELVEYPSITTISKWSSKSQHLALSTSSSQTAVQLRTRQSPEGPETSCYTYQLNLLDILDFAIEILPQDANALIILTHHDLYETEEDDFCIGRAFGGSRVCVVSSARYHPYAEELAGVGSEEAGGEGHDWPGSHCAGFVQNMCQDIEEGSRKKKKQKVSQPVSDETLARTPMYRAMAAHISERSERVKHREVARSLWLSRLCKTAAHELLHCFGVDHCVYYACSMQGTTCILEDTRQPLYLCPIDQAKLKEALAGNYEDIAKMSKERWEAEWCLRMKEFCDKMVARHPSLGWRPMSAWLEGRIEELGGSEILIGTKRAPIELD